MTPDTAPFAASEALAKVPQVTLVFWLIKIAATTLGETGGDTVTRSWLGETPIIASTTVGTTLADFADRSLGIGYFGGSSLLLVLLLGSLFAWHRSLGSIAVETVAAPEAEMF